MKKTDNGSPAAGKSLGVSACIAIVVGNMVGSGFYLSPAAVAPYGNLAIIAWVVMGFGAVCLGLTFAKLARLAPATGGPYAYTRMAYGDFAGFLIAWGYWISIWTSLPVIALAFAGAVMDLFPALHNRPMAVMLTLAAIWAVVFVNLRGVKAAGIFSEVTTYTKLVPFAAIALIGLFFIDTSHFSEFNPSGKSLLGASAALAPLTMFAFLGLESATVPAGDVRNPKRTIPLSTVLGIVIAALLYVLGTIAVMGLVPREQLVHSVAPFSDAARVLWGSWGATVISLAIILSAIGALNGWTLLMGQVPMAAAQRQTIPAAFWATFAAGRAGLRDHSVGRLCDFTGFIASRRPTRLLRGLYVNRRPEHDGRGHTLCLLRAGNRPCRRVRRGRRSSPTIDSGRSHRIHLRGVHTLRLRRASRALWLDNARARHTGLRVAEAPRRPS